ncbi:MAG: hypothetical protein WAU36_17785, partial [Cyclobacteriaceae bacterium]
MKKIQFAFVVFLLLTIHTLAFDQIICSDQIVAVSNIPGIDSCMGQVVFKASAKDETTCSDSLIYWKIYIDLWGDGTVDYEYSSYLPENDSLFLDDTNTNGIIDKYIAPGRYNEEIITDTFLLSGPTSSHKIIWTFTDCNSVKSECRANLTVLDLTPPMLKAKADKPSIMVNGQDYLTAKDYVKESSDNCTPKEKLLYTFFGA